MSRVPPWIWIFLFPVALGAPFIGRAYFVDDHYQMLMARGTLEHPARPYDFKADDNGPANAGWAPGQPPRMVNPPLHHYILGQFWRWSGHRLWAVRAFSLLLAGGSALLIYLLAARLMIPPAPAALLSVITPAFWLTSYSLLIDGTMLFFFLAALWTWIEGLSRRSASWLAGSGFLMGLTVLTKYTGALVFPLAAIYWAMNPEHRRRPGFLSAFSVGATVLAAWSLWNRFTYGADHFTESAKRVVHHFSWTHGMVALIFFSGVFLVPLVGWIGGKGWKKTGLAFGGALFCAAFFASPWGGFPWGTSLWMGFLLTGSLLFLTTVAQGLGESRYPSDRFLVGWLALGLGQMMFVMPWVAARYYLTILVPTIFLAFRWAQSQWRWRPAHGVRWGWVGGVAMVLFSGGMAVGDYLQAETQRSIVQDVARDGWLQEDRRGIYLGDSFTSSYLKYAGWEPGFTGTNFRPGDWVIRPAVTMPPWWIGNRLSRWRLVKVYDYPSLWPWRVMDNRLSAGFYASCWGVLPWVFSIQPLERYILYVVEETR